MIKETWERVLENQDVRQNLSRLRKEIKEGGGKAALLCHVVGKEDQLVRLLKHEDAKIRKNAALLMGDLGKPQYLKPLYQAYQSEEQLFVKSAYLSAIKNFDYRPYLDELKDRLESLTAVEPALENQKHIMEEIRELSSLIVRMEGVAAHRFHDIGGSYDLILLTNRNFPELTLKGLVELEPGARTRIFGAGVIAKTGNLHWVKELRTYLEMLFIVKGMQTCPMDAEKAAEIIVKSGLIRFLDKAHKGEAPYYFRVEFKSKMDLGERSAFSKHLAAHIERMSGRKLINTTSHYELEIRLIENKEGNCNILVKLFTLKDERFSYRKEVTPTSIRPVNAALTVALAKGFMKENAQVLDPFCGVGTMLIERHKAVPANTTFGIDIQADAIEKARENTKAAHQLVHYVNRDFFDFQHDYLFDEIITDMPFKIGRTTEEEIYDLYQKFFIKAGACLKKSGVIILYSHNRDYVKELSRPAGFKIVGDFEISKKEGAYVMVLVRGNQ